MKHGAYVTVGKLVLGVVVVLSGMTTVGEAQTTRGSVG